MARGEPDAVLDALDRLDRGLAAERQAYAADLWPSDEITARHEVDEMVREAVAARDAQGSQPELSLGPTHLRLRGLRPGQLLVALLVLAIAGLVLGALWIRHSAGPPAPAMRR